MGSEKNWLADLAGKEVLSARLSDEGVEITFTDGAVVSVSLMDQPAELSVVYRRADGQVLDL